MGQVSMSNARSYDLAEAPPSGRRGVAVRPATAEATAAGGRPVRRAPAGETTLSEDVTLTQITSEQARARAASAPVDRISPLAPNTPTVRCCWISQRTPHTPSRSCWIWLESDANPSPGVQGSSTWVPGEGATVVLRFSGAAQYAGNLSVVVGDNASLELVSVQNWSGRPVHAGISPPGSAAMPACAASW